MAPRQKSQSVKPDAETIKQVEVVQKRLQTLQDKITRGGVLSVSEIAKLNVELARFINKMQFVTSW